MAGMFDRLRGGDDALKRAIEGEFDNTPPRREPPRQAIVTQRDPIVTLVDGDGRHCLINTRYLMAAFVDQEDNDDHKAGQRRRWLIKLIFANETDAFSIPFDREDDANRVLEGLR